jgi:hypothetical protein
MDCVGTSWREQTLMIGLALGLAEQPDADVAAVFPQFAAALADAETADTAGLLNKAPLTEPPSKITRLSELLAPLIAAGDPGGANPNIYGILKSAWNFDSISVSGIIGDDDIKETNAMLAVLTGLAEAPDAQLQATFPTLWSNLNNRKAASALLDKENQNNRFSALVRLSELTRVLQGEFPNEWWDWLNLTTTEYPQLFDLYRLQAAGDEIQVQGQTLWDYLTGAVGTGADVIDIVTDIADSAVGAGNLAAGAATEGAGLILQAGLIGAITGLSAQLKTIQDNQATADTNDTARINRILNVLGGQAAIDNPQTLTGKSMLTILQELIKNEALPDGVNLHELLQQMGSEYSALVAINSTISQIQYDTTAIASSTSAMSTAMGNIDLLMDDLLKDEALSDGVNLYELDQRLSNAIDALECICRNTTFILIELPSTEPYGQSSQPAAGLSQPADLCQRVRWLVNNILLSGFAILNTPPITKARVLDVYQREIGVPVPGEFAADIAMIANAYHRDIAVPQGISAPIAWMDYMAPFTDEMVCTLFEGGTAQQSLAKWHVYWDGKGAGALPFPSLAKDMIWGDLINALFSQGIPLADSQAALYSNDCSGCNSVGNIVPTTPPGGWNTSRCSHCAYSANDPYANPSDPQLVYFYRDDPTKYDFANYFSSKGEMPDRWTITTNLKGWKVGFGVLDPFPPGYDIEIYDAGALLATLDGSIANPPEYDFAADTNSIQLRITSGYNSACLRTPIESSGWPFTGS